MSIDIYAFLGSETHNLESRLLHAFTGLGFSMELHPEMNLLETNSTECLYIAALTTPFNLKRVQEGTPLLISFGYSASKIVLDHLKTNGWPPKKVKQYTYEVCTRSSSGRSLANYFAQALTVAILAKETNGYFYINGDEYAVSGATGLKRILKELDMLKDRDFDVGAFPFRGWPTMTDDTNFSWPDEIQSKSSPSSETSKLKKIKKFKLSLFDIIGLALVAYFVIVTFVYS